MKQFFTAAMLLIATTFCSQVKAQKVSDADTKSISKFYENMMGSFGSFDAGAVASYYTENGVHISPDGQVVAGREALKTFYQQLFEMIRSFPRPDKRETNQTNWNTRYLGNDLINVTYTDETTYHYGNKIEKETFAMSVVLKRTKDSWLCEQVTMTPVKPLH